MDEKKASKLPGFLSGAWKERYMEIRRPGTLLYFRDKESSIDATKVNGNPIFPFPETISYKSWLSSTRVPLAASI